MNFVPTKKHKQVLLKQGLSLLKSQDANKLYSDGLCADEHIYYNKDKGFCYEDGCVIGKTIINTYERLNELEWIANSNFYVENIKNNIEDKHLIVGIVMKPFLLSQLTGSIWDDLYVKQNFADILARFNTNCIGIIPQGISLDRLNSNDIDLSIDKSISLLFNLSKEIPCGIIPMQFVLNLAKISAKFCLTYKSSHILPVS